jgi:hypothetical protein
MRRATVDKSRGHGRTRATSDHASHIAAAMRPTVGQKRYLAGGLMEPGGKLPLFDHEGREVPRQIIQSCMGKGWAEPWAHNPIKPDWLVCRLTAAGYRVLGVQPASAAPQG